MMTEEHKAKMKLGRERAAAARAANPKPAVPTPAAKPRPAAAATSEAVAPSAEFMGLTMKDCCIGCTPERCVIAGSLVFKNPDGTKGLVGHCGHPKKGGLQAIHQTKTEIVKRYNRAKLYLEHIEIDKKQ